MAGWQSGHAAACKAVYAGSIPTSASITPYDRLTLMAMGDAPFDELSAAINEFRVNIRSTDAGADVAIQGSFDTPKSKTRLLFFRRLIEVRGQC